MVLAGSAMLALALGYLVLAVLVGKFGKSGDEEGPAGRKPGRALRKKN
jgi:hypothetical protein